MLRGESHNVKARRLGGEEMRWHRGVYSPSSLPDFRGQRGREAGKSMCEETGRGGSRAWVEKHRRGYAP